jgi:hypothetical protein
LRRRAPAPAPAGRPEASQPHALSWSARRFAQVIRADPCKALTYPAVFNLCTLYDLQGSEGAHKKQMIHSLVRQYAPDDFDVTACKL